MEAQTFGDLLVALIFGRGIGTTADLQCGSGTALRFITFNCKLKWLGEMLAVVELTGLVLEPGRQLKLDCFLVLHGLITALLRVIGLHL